MVGGRHDVGLHPRGRIDRDDGAAGLAQAAGYVAAARRDVEHLHIRRGLTPFDEQIEVGALAMGRALMARPKLLMLDEPSLGLAPILVETIFSIIREINSQGTTVLLVEQNAHKALEVAHRGYVLETGSIVKTGTGQELLASEDVQKAYLGM